MSDTHSHNDRLHYLDSIRGIAACMVVMGHFIEWRWNSELWVQVCRFFINPHAAVSFFFVLSGFVLSYRLVHSDVSIHMPNYWIRRALRLYPAYVFTVVFTLFYLNFDVIRQGGIPEDFLDPDKAYRLLRELVMVRVENHYYGPGWTLGEEMTVSLLVPFIVIVARRDIRMVWALLWVIVFLGPYISDFVLHFTLGVLVAYYYPFIRSEEFKQHTLYRHRYRWLPVAFLLLTVLAFERTFGTGKGYNMIMNLLKIKHHHFSAVGSAGILVFAIMSTSWQRVLHWPVFLFLGRISYGIYLAHWLWVMRYMNHFERYEQYFGNTVVAGVVCFLAIAGLTLVSSVFLYYAVEKPFIARSRRFQFIRP